ncbi:MAG: SRPBCC family protein [Solirubrobacterales bacterium]|nr:SRPBCC family protein [Solirubrobacterales bacterium]
MGPISLTITVDAPRERVFDFLSDLSRRPSFTDHFQREYRLERLEPAGLGAAARFRVGAPGGIRYMETVITEADRPHRIVERGKGGRLDRVPIQTMWELTLGSSLVTEVTLTFSTEPVHGIDLLREMPRAGHWWKHRWSRALKRLAEVVESGDDPGEVVRVAGGNPHATGIR